MATSTPAISRVIFAAVLLCSVVPRMASAASDQTPATSSADWTCEFSCRGPDASRLPSSIEVRIRNRSTEQRELTLPTKQVAIEGGQPGSLLCIQLTARNGTSEVFVYASTNEPAVSTVPVRARLAPGAVATNNYSMSEFFRWGPCGPDASGSLAEHIKPGAEMVRMKLLWFPDNDSPRTNRVDSESHPLLVNRPAWLFRREGS